MKYLLTIWMSAMFLVGVAQNQPTALEKVEAAKIALITERLNLTPEQAEKFWPIYKEFNDKQRGLRQEFQQMRAGHDPKTASDAENKQMLNKGLQIKQRQLDLEKTYSNRMQQVISTQQLMSLRKAENDFRQMLMQRIREQQHQRNQIQQNRLQNNENMLRKRNN